MLIERHPPSCTSFPFPDPNLHMLLRSWLLGVNGDLISAENNSSEFVGMVSRDVSICWLNCLMVFVSVLIVFSGNVTSVLKV